MRIPTAWDLPAVSRQIPGQKFFLEQGENQSTWQMDGCTHTQPCWPGVSCSSGDAPTITERWGRAEQPLREFGVRMEGDFCVQAPGRS